MTFLGPTKNAGPLAPVTIRRAGSDDDDALGRLAQLDSSAVPRGTVLIAEVGDEVWAALSADDFQAIADPFRPSGELVLVLAERARSLRRSEHRSSGRPARLRFARPRRPAIG